MTSNYTIRLYEPGDEEAINNGFNEIFGTNRSLEEWRWKFQGDQSWIVVTFDDDGKIISNYSAICERLKYEDKIYTVGQSVDSYRIRRPSTAQAPVFVETGKFFFDRYCNPEHLPFLYGFPGEHAKHVGGRYLGYQVVKIDLWQKQISGRQLPWQRGKIGTVPPPSEQVDDLWKRSSARYPITLVRDSFRFQRRFISHRSRTYQYLMVQEKGRLAALGITLQVGDALKWIELVWDGENPKTLINLEAQVMRLGRSLNAKRVEMWLSGDQQAASLFHAQGWTSGEDPHQPYFCGITQLAALDEQKFLRDAYLMMGDSDLV